MFCFSDSAAVRAESVSRYRIQGSGAVAGSVCDNLLYALHHEDDPLLDEVNILLGQCRQLQELLHACLTPQPCEMLQHKPAELCLSSLVTDLTPFFIIPSGACVHKIGCSRAILHGDCHSPDSNCELSAHLLQPIFRIVKLWGSSYSVLVFACRLSSSSLLPMNFSSNVTKTSFDAYCLCQNTAASI